MQIFKTVFLGVILALSFIYTNLAYAKDTVNTPPEKITCTDGLCKLDDKYQPYLQINNSGSGIYNFDFGYASTNLLYYYYKNDKEQRISITTTYWTIVADLTNSNWQKFTNTTYKCTASANACPFTGTPYLKNK